MNGWSWLALGAALAGGLVIFRASQKRTSSEEYRRLADELDDLVQNEGARAEDAGAAGDAGGAEAAGAAGAEERAAPGNDAEDEPARLNAAEALAARQAEDVPQRLAKWKTREVGPKKAKSLAKREQRRQYYEYVRQLADEGRERERAEREVFGDLLDEEQEERRARIAAAHEAIEARKKARRAQAEEDRVARDKRRDELAAQVAAKGRAALTSDEDILLAESLGHIVSDGQWVLAVTDELVDQLAKGVNGRVNYADLAKYIE